MSAATAREQALHVRSVRCRVRRDLRACTNQRDALADCARLIADPAPELATLAVYDLLLMGKRCGPSVALEIIDKARVSAIAKVGQPGETRQGWLTETQREDLVAILNGAPAKRTPRAVARPKPRGPAPLFARWCPTCAEYALPMRDGTCGFCDTTIDGGQREQKGSVPFAGEV